MEGYGASLARLVADGHAGPKLLGQQLLCSSDDDAIARDKSGSHPPAGRGSIRRNPDTLEAAGCTTEIRPGEAVPLHHCSIRDEYLRPCRTGGNLAGDKT
jgi:hypothetical protein